MSISRKPPAGHRLAIGVACAVLAPALTTAATAAPLPARLASLAARPAPARAATPAGLAALLPAISAPTATPQPPLALRRPPSARPAIASLTARPAASLAGSVTVGTLPTGVAATNSRAYVANSSSNTVSVVDLSQSPAVVIATVHVGTYPFGVALSPDGSQVYVTNFDSNTLSVISTATNAVTKTVPVGSHPAGVVRVGSAVYVANLLSSSVSVIDPVAGTVTGTIALTGTGAPEPSGLAANADGSRLYVDDDHNASTIVVNLTAAPPVELNSVGVGSLPAYLSVAGTTGWVASPGSNNVSVLGLAGSPPTVTHTVPVDGGDYGVVSLPSLNQTLVTSSTTGAVDLINPSTFTSVRSFTVGSTPDGIAVTPDGTKVLVANEGSNTISIVPTPPSVTALSFSGAVANTSFGVGTTPAQPSTQTSGSVLSGSTDPNGLGLQAVAATIATTHGGQVALNADGTFTYTPPAGFTGTDTFDFTVTNGTSQSTGRATVTVANRVWYVNDSLPTNGNGTAASPFNALSAVTGPGGPTAAGDYIYLFGSATPYAGGIALKTSQTLVGQSADLVVGGQTVATHSGSNPTITNAGGAGITLAEADTVAGITVSGTSGAGISATNVDDFTLASTDRITSTGGDDLDIVGGSGTVSDAATTSTTTAVHPLEIENRGGGTVTVAGNIGDTGASSVLLSNNTGATIGFTGQITASTGSTKAFQATGGGTVTATGAGSTLATTTATALDVENTTIGPAGLDFQSVSSNGPANGIVLASTGSAGGLSVTGTGAANSGGTIQSASGNAISLTTTQSPSFNDMDIVNPQHSGVFGRSVTGFSFTNGTITGAGAAHSSASDDAIAFNDNSTPGTEDNLSGAITITGDTITNPYGSGVEIDNFAGTIADADISNNTISSTNGASTSKGTAITLDLAGNQTTVASLTKAELETNTITNFPSGGGIDILGGNNQSQTAPSGTYGVPGNATDVVTVSGNLIHGTATGQCLSPNPNCMDTQAINVAVTGRGQGNFAIDGNGNSAQPLGETLGTTLGVLFAGTVNAAAAIENNVVAAGNSLGSDGIGIGEDTNTQANSTVLSNPTVKLTVTGNTVSRYDGDGIQVLQRDSNGTLALQLTGNTTSAPEADDGAGSGLEVDAGSSGSSSFNPSLCSQINSNTDAAGNDDGFGDTVPGIVVNKLSSSSTTYIFGLVGLSPSPANPAQTQAYVGGQNPASALGGGFYAGERANVEAGDQFTSCTLPAGMP